MIRLLSEETVSRYLRLAVDFRVRSYPLRAIAVYKLLLRADPSLGDEIQARLSWCYREIGLRFDEASVAATDQSRWEAIRALEELES